MKKRNCALTFLAEPRFVVLDFLVDFNEALEADNFFVVAVVFFAVALVVEAGFLVVVEVGFLVVEAGFLVVEVGFFAVLEGGFEFYNLMQNQLATDNTEIKSTHLLRSRRFGLGRKFDLP